MKVFFLAQGILALMALTTPLYLVADHNKIDISLEDAKYFPGNFSLTPEEIYLALKHCSYREKFTILEFGAGESTVQLSKLLTQKHIPFEYHVFENDPLYIKNIGDVHYHYYFLPSIPFHRCSEWNDVVARYTLPDLPNFDLVIVDGPHGVARSQWYSKFKKYTKPGTIILIDDFQHFKEFGEALDKNFTYSTVIEYNQCPSWKIANEGMEHLTYYVNKTFKIVKVISTK